jgi:hypothetical protein
MALYQHHQDMEVIRRRRPELPKPSDIPDIERYCETCQKAYRIGWQALLVIVECMQAKNMLMHNIDINITHKWKLGSQEVNTSLTKVGDRRISTHTCSLFSHNIDDYVMNAGIQVMLPLGPHQSPCQHVTIEINMPIRKEAPYDIIGNMEEALIRVAEATHKLNTTGITVTDQQSDKYVIRNKIKVVVGNGLGLIPLETGYNRKVTYYHQTPPVAWNQASSVTPEDSQSAAILIEKSTSIPTEYAESMEIDIEEASEKVTEAPVSRKPIAKEKAAQIEAWSKGISKGKEPVERKQGYLTIQPVQTPEGSSGNERDKIVWPDNRKRLRTEVTRDAQPLHHQPRMPAAEAHTRAENRRAGQP